MATNLPKATTNVQDTAGAPVGGLDTICILSPVATNPDVTPRYFGSAQAIYDQHGYSEGLEYAALHIQETGNSVLFVGLPIVTQGVLSRRNNDGNTGTANVTVTPGANGPLHEHDGVVEVVNGGIVGVDQIVLGLSLDGRTFQMLRVGVANSIAIPFLEVTIGLESGKTLVAGDTVLTWHGTGPKADAAGLQLARDRLAGQQKPFRTLLLCGDLADHTEAQTLLDFANAYRTENERFVFARGSIADRLPLPVSSSVKRVVSGASLTFASAGKTITRAAGSWITDGYAVGQAVYSTGTVSNNGFLGILTGVTATVLTFTVATLVNEGPISTATISARESLVFAATTITRGGSGSWVGEGFKVGQTITVAGTVSNNGTKVLTGVTATVLTFASGGVAESIGAGVGTVTQSLTKAAWMALQDLEFSTITNAPRISLSAGRARKVSPFSQWNFRRPASWGASIRTYQHDLHVVPWRKDLGPLSGWDLTDEEGNLYEWDDRVDGKAGVRARFTCYRTWANGQVGCYVALDLTRANEGSNLAHTAKQSVTDLICTVVQLNSEDSAIGVDLILNDDGTATTASLAQIAGKVNNALTAAVLTDARGEGPRASKALFTIDPTTLFNVPEPEMVTVTDTILNGTVFSVRNNVRVRTGGN
jgi:hypothetical protein